MNINEIIYHSRFLVDGDSGNMPATALTDPLVVELNANSKKVAGWILGADGRWQWDDTNNTDFPRGTTSLVAGQLDYQLDGTYIEIEAVEALGVDGKYYPLTQIDKDDIKRSGLSITEYSNRTAAPQQYDFDGSSIILDSKPSASTNTLAAGLKVYGKRTAAEWTIAEISAGVKQPGFASPFQMVLPYMNSIPFCIKNHPDRVASYREIVGDFSEREGGPRGFKAAIIQHYSRRNKDERNIMTPKRGMFGTSTIGV